METVTCETKQTVVPDENIEESYEIEDAHLEEDTELVEDGNLAPVIEKPKKPKLIIHETPVEDEASNPLTEPLYRIGNVSVFKDDVDRLITTLVWLSDRLINGFLQLLPQPEHVIVDSNMFTHIEEGLLSRM